MMISRAGVAAIYFRAEEILAARTAAYESGPPPASAADVSTPPTFDVSAVAMRLSDYCIMLLPI